MPDEYEGYKVVQDDGLPVPDDKQPDENRFGETPGEAGDPVDPSQGIGQEAVEGIDEQGTQEQVDTHQQPPDIEEGGFDEEFDQPAEGKQKWTSHDGYAPKGSK